ncbi:hypothetical protein B0T25DRAFT_621586 [Lasiosphaeria hispida]|uniref:Uncharacterized protein n=1 Tax=Lasiosphaeria hispida TaxID=260671 RepID=A0AAJ0HT34_9PEZI|nr:hypothetical protein B0T25DRAFT_621586 [Lasiosphaeria hispida]
MTDQNPERSPLVETGSYKGPSSHPQTFLTHTLPEIHDNTIVVAATSPTVQTGNQTKDGWFLSDFYAFNYLLKDAVKDQTWLTAAKPQQLVEKWGDFLHGSPRRDRKVVLSSELIQSGISPVTIVEAPKMIERFLEEVEKASIRARQIGCPLLLMVFCHGIKGHYLCLDNGTQNKGLSIVRLQGVLDPNIKVALFTTACYSSGWALSTDLNITAMTAAKPDNESVSWRVSESIGRACGSMFASAAISALTEASTPLLASDAGSQEATAEADMSLQPEEPTKQQTETYNEFCRTITTTLQPEWEFRIFGEDFHFSAQNDEWEWSWTRRTGIPLAYFEERWNQLETIPRREFPKPGDDNYTGSHRTGSANSYMDDMTREMAHSRVFGMAELFRQLCPGDWCKGWNVALAGDFFNFLRGRPGAPSAEYIAEVIYFRWDTCLFVDRFVADHGLCRPDDKICVMWDSQTYPSAMSDRLGRNYWRKHYYLVWDALFKGGASIEPAEHQGPPFSRPHAYIASAIAETYSTKEEALVVVDAFCQHVSNLRKFHIGRAIESPSVRRLGRTWLRSDEASSSSKGKKLGEAPELQQPQRQRLEEDDLEG